MMALSGKSVLVTGGAGFIGSHTVDALLAAGAKVSVFDNLSTGKLSNLAQHKDNPALQIVVGNVADGLFAPFSERKEPFAAIIHLAAQVSVVYSIENPLEEIRTNYVGTAQVCEYARKSGVKNLVFASSAAVYGDTPVLPVVEDMVTDPLSPYGIDKRASELFLRYHSLVHGIASTPLRFFNVYGPRQDPKSPYSGVISVFIDRAASGRDLTIFGDGEQTRDFVYVKDLVTAIVTAAGSTDRQGHPVNLGTGTRVSINDLAKTVIEICQSRSKILYGEARGGEIRHSQSSIARAQKELGFAPAVGLAQGLAETIAWAKNG